MARKRANTIQSKNNKAIVAPKMEIVPLEQQETGYFQQLVESSNQYACLLYTSPSPRCLLYTSPSPRD